MIKLVIFDLWKTLEYKDLRNNTTYEIKKLFNLKISRAKLVKIFETSIQTKRWKTKNSAYKNLCKNLGVETTKENIDLLINLRDKIESKIKLYKHTIPMLKKLRKKGYKIGLISNTSIFTIKPVKKTGLFKYIDYHLFSFEVGKIKPDVKAFKKMLKISKTKPKEAIMIGDKIIDDVVPPKKIGINAIHFKNYSQLKKDFKKFDIEI